MLKFFSDNLLLVEMKRTHILLNKPVYLAPSILEISKIVMYKFLYETRNQNYATWIQTTSESTQKQKTFMQTLQKMLKQDLILQIMNEKDHYLREKKNYQINEI